MKTKTYQKPKPVDKYIIAVWIEKNNIPTKYYLAYTKEERYLESLTREHYFTRNKLNATVFFNDFYSVSYVSYWLSYIEKTYDYRCIKEPI